MPEDEAPKLPADTWIEVLQREYLHSYILAGGAAVKVPVVEDAALRRSTWDRLKRLAADAGYLVVEVRSEETKIHLAQEIFFRVARAVPWEELAASVAVDAVEQDTGYRAEPGTGPIARRLEAQYALDQPMVRQATTRGLLKLVYRDAGMARDFRLAMLPLCNEAVNGPGSDSEAVRAWLTGEPLRLTSLKALGIYTRITRANAMVMFDSLLHWLRKAGRPGILLLLDMARLVEKPPRPRGEGVYYTRAALLDAYEVIRQLIDGTDRMEGCLVAAFAEPPFLDPDDRGRGMAAYQALHYRLTDEVRGRSVANPMSSLVRLTP